MSGLNKQPGNSCSCLQGEGGDKEGEGKGTLESPELALPGGSMGAWVSIDTSPFPLLSIKPHVIVNNNVFLSKKKKNPIIEMHAAGL